MKNFINKLLDFFELVIMGGIIFVIVYFFVGQLVRVSGKSMEPSLYDGQQLLTEKITVNITNLNRGDIIIFNSIEEKDKSSHLLIKRIIGLPGEKIKIQEGAIYINDQRLEEPYLQPDTFTTLKANSKIKEGEEYMIGEDSYFVLGDNRNDSVDSRVFGTLHKNNILGKAVVRYYPLNDFKII